jgi:hypothetical protein
MEDKEGKLTCSLTLKLLSAPASVIMEEYASTVNATAELVSVERTAIQRVSYSSLFIEFRSSIFKNPMVPSHLRCDDRLDWRYRFLHYEGPWKHETSPRS